MNNKLTLLLVSLLAVLLIGSWIFFYFRLNNMKPQKMGYVKTNKEDINISTDNAKKAIREYGRLVRPFGKDKRVPVCWTIKKSTIDQLNEQYRGYGGFGGIRLYIGQKEINDTVELQLISVPIVGIKDTVGSTLQNLIQPCPTLCDTSSSLYQAFVDGRDSD
ncbi:MAG: hypothetical protein ACFB10_21775 [Salibacteraceae bacterium]